MIEGLSHIPLLLRDLDRMEQCLTTVFDAQGIPYSGDKTCSYDDDNHLFKLHSGSLSERVQCDAEEASQ